MPPKGSSKKKVTSGTDADSSSQVPSLSEQLSYLHAPRPFKNPDYNKNVSRRAKNVKAVLSVERERERLEREKDKTEKMEVDGQEKVEGDSNMLKGDEEEMPTYSSIEAPPSVLPQRRYCDITGLEAPYTDPATELRYHDKNVYELIKSLSASAAKDYLAARGVNTIMR